MNAGRETRHPPFVVSPPHPLGEVFHNNSQVPYSKPKSNPQPAPHHHVLFYRTMDFISHTLWGGAAFGRKSKRAFLWAAAFSVLPDLLSEGLMFLLVILGLSGMPTLNGRHPDITEFPLYAQNFYNATHSLIIFVLLFLSLWFILKKFFLPFLAWGLHILIDIPTHSFALFPTPFLWPFSDFKLNGIGWHNPIILIPNILLLILVYTLWFLRTRRKHSSNAPSRILS